MKNILLAAFGLVSLFGFTSQAMAHDRDCDDGHYRCEDYRRHHHDERCDDHRRWEDYRHRGVRIFVEGCFR